MNFSPESFPIVEGHEPAASDAIAAGGAACKIGNADGVWIIVQEDYDTDATPLVLTVNYGATSALAIAGATSIASFGGWKNITAQTSDAITALTAGATQTLDGETAGNNCIWMFYIPGAAALNGWIQADFAAGNAANTASVLYVLDRARYKSSAPSGNGSLT